MVAGKGGYEIVGDIREGGGEGREENANREAKYFKDDKQIKDKWMHEKDT